MTGETSADTQGSDAIEHRLVDGEVPSVAGGSSTSPSSSVAVHAPAVQAAHSPAAMVTTTQSACASMLSTGSVKRTAAPWCGPRLADPTQMVLRKLS